MRYWPVVIGVISPIGRSLREILIQIVTLFEVNPVVWQMQALDNDDLLVHDVNGG